MAKKLNKSVQKLKVSEESTTHNLQTCVQKKSLYLLLPFLTFLIMFVKVLMATNRPDTLDPALMRPGRLDRKVEFGLPDLEGRSNIFKIHARSMSVERDIRYDLLARLCPNSTGAEIRSVCTEAGMFAIRSRRKVATEKDFLDAINKVIKAYAKFSSTPKYMTYN